MNYVPESRIEAAATELWMRYDLQPVRQVIPKRPWTGWRPV